MGNRKEALRSADIRVGIMLKHSPYKDQEVEMVCEECGSGIFFFPLRREGDRHGYGGINIADDIKGGCILVQCMECSKVYLIDESKYKIF